jgi:hypothetical protein
MKRKAIISIGVPYFSLNLFLFLFNYVTYPTLNEYTNVYMNYLHDHYGTGFFYIFNILALNIQIFGFLFALVSVLYLYRLKARRSIIFGIGATICYVINVLNLVFSFQYKDDLSYQGPGSNPIVMIIFVWIAISLSNLVIFTLLRSEKKDLKLEDLAVIKKTILDLGTKYTRLEIPEISEKSGYDADSIVFVLNDMIENNEIYAEFFKSSNTVSFNQRANLDEIDELLATFKNWEEQYHEKLENQEFKRE